MSPSPEEAVSRPTGSASGSLPGLRLDLALVRRHPGLPRRKARDVIEKGQVAVDGRTVREPGHPVPEDAVVTWDPNRRALPKARLSLPALFEDEHLLVVDKPAGLLSVPTGTAAAGEDTVLKRVQEYLRRLRPRNPYVGRVHRLDRDTSGALVVALTPAARAGLIRLFARHRIERRYLALVDGVPRADEGTVDQPIREAYVGGRRGIAGPGEEGVAALTRWRVVERFARGALLEVALETGRQHQVRIHLAHLRLPILGDATYGPPADHRSPVRARRPMLHARSLGFAHPITGEMVRVSSPPPEDFREAIRSLGRPEPAPPPPPPRRRPGARGTRPAARRTSGGRRVR